MTFTRTALAACVLAASASAYDAFVVTTPGIPGAGGLVPALSASGIVTPGSSGNVLALTDAAPNSIAQIVVGFNELAMPYKGGVLGPQPELLTEQFFTDGLGGYEMNFSLPTDTAVGLEIWIQTFVFDTGAVGGLSASNTLRLTAQQTLDIKHVYPFTIYPMGTTNDVILEDFNSDDILDVVAANSSTITIRLGVGEGLFGDAQSFAHNDVLGRASLASGDFDQDGHLDVAITNYADNRMYLFLGNGEGAFSLGESYSTGKGPIGIEVADLNGNGRLDVVFVTAEADKINLRRGKGDGTFWPVEQVAPGNKPVAVAIDDLNGDGILDMVVAYEFMNDVSVLLGKGLALFEPAVGYPAAGRPAGLDIFDLDENGTLDIMVKDSLLGGSNALFGNGDGTFAFPTQFTPLGAVPTEYSDFNQDGFLDLITVRSLSPIPFPLTEIEIHLRVAPMTYGESTKVEIPCLAVFGLDLGDINNDGLPDIVMSRFVNDYVMALMNPGDGAFSSSPAQLDPDLDVADINHGDFNGDGREDLVVAHRPQALSVKLATGDGEFGAPTLLASLAEWPFPPLDVVVEDFNADGVLDVLWTLPGQVLVHLGVGDGTFGDGIATPMPNGANAVMASSAMLDGDAIPDIALAINLGGGLNFIPYHYITLIGVGDGTFTLGTPATSTNRIKQLELRDINGDEHADLILVANNRFNIRFGIGDGTFGESMMPIEVTPGSGLISSFAFGDFDIDTVEDVVVTWTNGLGTKYQFARGNGDGTYDLVLPKVFSGLLQAAADLNNDGKLDLLFQGSNKILPGVGDGTFGPPIQYLCLDEPHITITDFNGDCFPDIAIGDEEGISLLLSDP